MKRDIDELLKQALTPTDKPDFWLDQRILNQAKESNRMDMKKAKRIPAAAIAAAIVLGTGSVSAYAAWKYLAPEKVTENLNDKKLTDAFQGKDAVTVNERQSYGGYNVTFLGVVSGKDISEYGYKYNGSIHAERTYTVVAIENSDGTPMPEFSDDAYAELSFFTSPLIKGYDPNRYNVVTMRGGYSEFIEDGILYRLTECDNVEIFADCGLYLSVCDGTFYNQEAYCYDKASGEITRNEDYEGLNALFHLPIDVSKADPDAAAKYLTALEESEDEPEDADDGSEEAAQQARETAEMKAAETWLDQLTPENIDAYAKRVESTVQTLTPDEKGYVAYRYKVGPSSGSGTVSVAECFQDGKTKEIIDISMGETPDSMTISTLTLNEDGTVTFAVYIPKDK